MQGAAGYGGKGSDTEVGDLVIVGGGTAGWMAAAAFTRFLNNGRRRITLVESDAIGTVGVGEATIPPIIHFNRMLDINENAFLKATRGTFKLGIEFVNWGKRGDRYLHPFGNYGSDIHGIPFHQLWLRERQIGDPGPIDDYCVNAIAAAQRRFGRPSPDAKSPLQHIFYAFHFDASLYARFLRGVAERQGVVRKEGKIVGVEREGETGNVAAIVIESGERIAGDLFIDCSGFRGLLIEQELETGWDDWSRWLPCDRAIAVPTALTGSPDPFTRSTAHGAGWQWRIPLQHRMGNGHVFASSFLDEDEAHEILLANVEGEILAEPRTIRFATGRRKRSWNRNVVALGLSSGFLEPLEIDQHSPDTERHPAPACAVSRQADQPDRTRRVQSRHGRDVRRRARFHHPPLQGDAAGRHGVLAHGARHGRTGQPKRKMELWRLHGRIFREGAELFGVTSWVAVMLGQNLWPEAWDPIVDSLDEAKVALALRQMRARFPPRGRVRCRIRSSFCAAPAPGRKPNRGRPRWRG